MTAAAFWPQWPATGPTSHFGGMAWGWIYLAFPWIGALIAVIVYEFLFKKAQEVVQEREAEVDAEQALIDQQ